MSAIAGGPGYPPLAPVNRTAVIERIRRAGRPADVIEASPQRIVTESTVEGLRIRVEVLNESWAPYPAQESAGQTAMQRNAQFNRVDTELLRCGRTAAEVFRKESRP